MSQQPLVIKDYVPEYAEETVAVWRKSKEEALGQKEIHTFGNQVEFLNQVLAKQDHVELAFLGDKIVGMAAYNQEEISQLYIHPDYQGRGIGHTFLERIKAQSTGRLTLYTFQVNKKAQLFYERNGFVVIGQGYENMENLPDLKYEWKASS